MAYSLEQGKELVRAARAAIEGKAIKAKGFEEKRGVFVTLNSYPEKELRGCIGFPEPTFPLIKAIEDAAKSSAFHDLRFNPVEKGERFTVEISVLTVPEEIAVKSSEELPKKIKIGEDGLIVDFQGMKGLLLPQVFPEWQADEVRALEMACEKAGLPQGAWRDRRCKVCKFQAQIFRELTPHGRIVEEKQ